MDCVPAQTPGRHGVHHTARRVGPGHPLPGRRARRVAPTPASSSCPAITEGPGHEGRVRRQLRRQAAAALARPYSSLKSPVNFTATGISRGVRADASWREEWEVRKKRNDAAKESETMSQKGP